jgi:glycine/D-amino acid oxidase-like deaminating enzyme
MVTTLIASDCQRRLDVEFAPNDLLTSLVQGIPCPPAKHLDDGAARVAPIRSGSEFGSYTKQRRKQRRPEQLGPVVTTVRGVEVDGDLIEADAVIIAMGPWSLLAAEWMSLPAVFGQRSSSLVYDTGADVPPHALFLYYRD